MNDEYVLVCIYSVQGTPSVYEAIGPCSQPHAEELGSRLKAEARAKAVELYVHVLPLHDALTVALITPAT